MPFMRKDTTIQKLVEPGDNTGNYYLPFQSDAYIPAWQELKDWLSTSCNVEYVRLFPHSASGWIQLRGKDNFKRAIAHIQSKRFNCQHLRIDTRNDTEPVMICIEESNQASMAHGQRRRSNEWNRAHAVTPGHRSLNNQAPLQDSEAAPPDHDARSLPGNTSDADAAGTTYNDVLAAVERVCATNLREAMQNITFYTPPFPCPYYAWLYYHNMNPPVPFPYGGPPVLFSPQLEMLQPGMPLHGDVPYGAQLSPDESQGGERRSDSQPPGSSNNLS